MGDRNGPEHAGATIFLMSFSLRLKKLILHVLNLSRMLTTYLSLDLVETYIDLRKIDYLSLMV